MQQNMLVNVHEDETRIALTEDNQLVDLHIEQTARERTVGNIYRGVVVKVNPSFQAAFIEYGESRNGFLSLSDVNPKLFGDNDKKGGRGRIQSLLKVGQPVMVQVLKEGVGNKGAALTTFVSLAGRYLVLAPHTDRSGVSRKVEDADKRGPLKELINGLVGGDDFGVIIRTAGVDRTAAELKRDLANLRKEWQDIETAFNTKQKPGLLRQEAASLVRVLRDYFTDAVEDVWVDSPESYTEALQYFKAELPRFQKRLKLYVGDQTLFAFHDIERQIEALNSSRVQLKSGGSIIIESTEALVSIDVNSGRSTQGSDIEATALHTNLEAAEEICRQLRLRNLGGLVVIDFIDMMPKKNRDRVKEAVVDGLKNDKARCTVGEISQFGLLELSRQRIDMELSRGTRIQCDHCGGTGFVPTVNTSANNVLRKIRELAASGNHKEIHGDLPLEHANFLLNLRRESLRDLELEFGIHIHLFGDPEMPAGQPIQLSGTTEEGAKEEISNLIASSGDEEDAGKKRRRRRRGRGRGRDGEESTEETSFDDSSENDASRDDSSEERVADAEQGSSDETVDQKVEAKRSDAPKRDRDRGRGRGRGGRDVPDSDKSEKEESAAPANDVGGNGIEPTKGVLFASAHKPIVETDIPIVNLARGKRSTFSHEDVEEGTILFVSHRRGEPDAPKAEAVTKEEAKKPAGRGRKAKTSDAEAEVKEKPAAKKAAAKTTEKKPAAKKPATKTAAKKPAAKKPATKKPATKKKAE